MRKLSLAAFLLLLTTGLCLGQSKISVDASEINYQINRNIYGNFSEHLGHCIYGGIWVGENSKIPNTRGIRNDVVEALKKIKLPVLRWPGGCFADEYHWKDGIGPRNQRPSMINTHWGGVTEDNSFGTHEFLDFCKMVGCEPYFSGNLGSGTVQELAQWVEYVNSDNVSPMTDLRKKNGQDKAWGVKYWGVGNESWGCGGNMTAAFYTDQMRKYSTFMRNYGQNLPYKIASGPNSDDYNWTETVMKNGAQFISGLSLHYYTWYNSKTATDVTDAGWFDVIKSTMNMEELVTKHSKIMDKYDPGKRVALVVDEWGTWYPVEPNTNPAFLFQQNTIRDAIVAATNLNIFNNHCDRVKMTNIAQMINVLQAIILTDGEKMVLTPTYHVFDLFKVHQDALLIPSKVTSAAYVFNGQSIPAVNSSTSLDREGKMHISITNVDPKQKQLVTCDFTKYKPSKISGSIITASVTNAHNTFDKPNTVVSQVFNDFKLIGNNVEVTLPPMSVVVLEIEGTLDLPPAIVLKNPKAGLNYNFYKGTWNMLPDFDMLKPESTGTIEKVMLPVNNPGEYYGLTYSGYIKIEKNGVYTFYVTSDDGSKLFVDDKLQITNDGVHGSIEAFKTIFLRTGYHKLDLSFFQGNGGQELGMTIEGPNMPKQPIPSNMLFRDK